LTHFDGRDYDVTIDLSAVIARYGMREGNAIVLHELGHVVDIALVPDALRSELDAGIPTGEPVAAADRRSAHAHSRRRASCWPRSSFRCRSSCARSCRCCAR